NMGRPGELPDAWVSSSVCVCVCVHVCARVRARVCVCVCVYPSSASTQHTCETFHHCMTHGPCMTLHTYSQCIQHPVSLYPFPPPFHLTYLSLSLSLCFSPSLSTSLSTLRV